MAKVDYYAGRCYCQFLLGILIFSMMVLYWGESYLRIEDAKYGIVVDSMGMELGLKDGDKILNVGGVQLKNSARVS